MFEIRGWCMFGMHVCIIKTICQESLKAYVFVILCTKKCCKLPGSVSTLNANIHINMYRICIGHLSIYHIKTRVLRFYQIQHPRFSFTTKHGTCSISHALIAALTQNRLNKPALEHLKTLQSTLCN